MENKSGSLGVELLCGGKQGKIPRWLRRRRRRRRRQKLNERAKPLQVRAAVPA